MSTLDVERHFARMSAGSLFMVRLLSAAEYLSRRPKVLASWEHDSIVRSIRGSYYVASSLAFAGSFEYDRLDGKHQQSSQRPPISERLEKFLVAHKPARVARVRALTLTVTGANPTGLFLSGLVPEEQDAEQLQGQTEESTENGTEDPPIVATFPGAIVAAALSSELEDLDLELRWAVVIDVPRTLTGINSRSLIHCPLLCVFFLICFCFY